MRSFNGIVTVGLRRSLLAVGAGVLMLAGCEVPDAPVWDVGVALPFGADPISITDLLPDVVDTAVVGGQSVFTVELQQDSVDYSLGLMCAACAVLDGVTTNVPGFDYVDSLDVTFPSDLISVELNSAKLGLRVANSMNFDPLRPDPDPASAGYIALAVRDLGSGALLDSVLIRGDTASLPGGTSIQIELDISSATVTTGVRTIAYLHSPLDAQVVQIDTAMSSQFGTYLDQIYVAAITAMVATDTLEQSFVENLDEDLRNEMLDRVQGGSFELELTHDVEINGLLDVSIAGSENDLFSGFADREVRLGSFDLSYAPNGRISTSEVTVADLELIAGFVDVYVGYRGIATGSGTGPMGQPVSRFSPDQSLEAKFTVITRIRVGD